MANPQPNQHTRISNELYEAIMQSDFSKRQRNILDFIIRMSYGCGKKFAILRPSDFELVGVGRNHVQNELKHLTTINVLNIDGERYWLNKNYDTWRISISRSFDMEKFQKVLHRNLSDVPETETKVPEMGTYNDLDHEEEFPKREQESSQNGNSRVPKTGTPTNLYPLSGAGFRAPKESIKESIKDQHLDQEKLIDTEEVAIAADTSFSRIYGIFEEHFTENQKITPIEAEMVGVLFDEYGGDKMLHAMREAVKHRIKTLAYIEGILRGNGKPKSKEAPARDPELVARDKEIAFNKFVSAGGKPDEFRYNPTGTDSS